MGLNYELVYPCILLTSLWLLLLIKLCFFYQVTRFHNVNVEKCRTKADLIKGSITKNTPYSFTYRLKHLKSVCTCTGRKCYHIVMLSIHVRFTLKAINMMPMIPLAWLHYLHPFAITHHAHRYAPEGGRRHLGNKCGSVSFSGHQRRSVRDFMETLAVENISIIWANVSITAPHTQSLTCFLLYLLA